MEGISLNRQLKQNIMEYIKILVFALIFSWGFRSTIAEAMVVPTPSMLPTIQLQDRILVEKVTYKVQDIQRGDIVVFQPPKYVQEVGPDWVKRVIGLP